MYTWMTTGTSIDKLSWWRLRVTCSSIGTTVWSRYCLVGRLARSCLYFLLPASDLWPESPASSSVLLTGPAPRSGLRPPVRLDMTAAGSWQLTAGLISLQCCTLLAPGTAVTSCRPEQCYNVVWTLDCVTSLCKYTVELVYFITSLKLIYFAKIWSLVTQYRSCRGQI